MRDPSETQALFDALLAPYHLRDGHYPDQPFASPPHIGRGWYWLLKELIEDLIRLGWNREVLQIKEKYGSLRFYITQREQVLLDRIEAAVDQSYTVCEDCGGSGTWLDDKGAMSTLCGACRAKQRSAKSKA